MEYTVIQERGTDGLKHLIQKVNEHLKKGWKAQGGICESFGQGSTFYYQAMVKE